MVGLGRRSPDTKGKSDREGKPSSKQQLIDGALPRFKGSVPIDMNVTPPITVTVFSLPGLGKTHYGFTFPDVACCDTEMKGEKVWKKFYRGEFESYRLGDDGVEPYKWDKGVINPENSRLYHAENWGDVAAFYDHFIKDESVQTLMFDSETDLREFAELWTLKETGKKSLYSAQQGAGKVQYAMVFGKLKYILNNAKRHGKNLYYTAKVKDEYDQFGNKTGRLVYDGYNKQTFFSGYVLYLRSGVENEKGETIYGDHVFAEVRKCEDMMPGQYPPYIPDPSYKGIIEWLVRGKSWDGTHDEFIRERIKPVMDELGVSRS